MAHEPTISRLIRVIGAGVEPFGALAIVPWHRLVDSTLHPPARRAAMLRRAPDPHRPMINRLEHTMKGNLLAAAVLALAALAAAGATANAAEYPYCSAGGGFGSHGSCGFSSFEQCRATVMGAGGFCHVNPAYGASRAAPTATNRVPLRSREVVFQRQR